MGDEDHPMSTSAFAKIIPALLLLFAGGCASAPDDGAAAGEAQVSDLVTSIEAQPFARIGTGKPGAGENDINTPDGVVFDANGSLLITDAMNHRVQVWDVRNGPRRLGQFGSADVFRGEIVDLAVSPVTGQLIVTDERTYLAYAFDPPSGKEPGDLKLSGYTLTSGDMFSTEVVKKVGGITFDSQGRIYTVDARQNLVRRYDATGKPDPTFKFAEKGGTAYLNGCEGIAIDEKRGNLYVSSEFTSAIQVFDLNDGTPKNKVIGRRNDAAHPTAPTGTSVFSAAVEGLWILDDYLLASDEADGGEGHVMIFDLREESVFDHDADDYARMKADNQKSGYIGSFGSFCSPDSVAAFSDKDGESYVAVADQCHYQVALYKWSDLLTAGKFGRHDP
jgi:DNA-binding beta-propeller fold protein YncE